MYDELGKKYFTEFFAWGDSICMQKDMLGAFKIAALVCCFSGGVFTDR